MPRVKMTKMSEISDKDFQTSIIKKMLEWAITDTLKQMKKQSLRNKNKQKRNSKETESLNEKENT